MMMKKNKDGHAGELLIGCGGLDSTFRAMIDDSAKRKSAVYARRSLLRAVRALDVFEEDRKKSKFYTKQHEEIVIAEVAVALLRRFVQIGIYDSAHRIMLLDDIIMPLESVGKVRLEVERQEEYSRMGYEVETLPYLQLYMIIQRVLPDKYMVDREAVEREMTEILKKERD